MRPTEIRIQRMDNTLGESYYVIKGYFPAALWGLIKPRWKYYRKEYLAYSEGGGSVIRWSSNYAEKFSSESEASDEVKGIKKCYHLYDTTPGEETVCYKSR